MSNADLEFLKSRLSGRLGLRVRSSDQNEEAHDQPHEHDIDETAELSFAPPVIFKSEDRPYWDVSEPEHEQADTHEQNADQPSLAHKHGAQAHEMDAPSEHDHASVRMPADAPQIETSSAYPQMHKDPAQSVQSGDKMKLFARSEANGEFSKSDQKQALLEAVKDDAHVALTSVPRDGHPVSAPSHNDDYLRSFAEQPAANFPQSETHMRGAVFSKIVKSDEDIVGLVAYSLYKLNKYDWALAFQKSKGREPNASEIKSFAIGESMMRRLAVYRQLAEQMLQGEGGHAVINPQQGRGQDNSAFNKTLASFLPTMIYLFLAAGSIIAGFAAFRFMGTLVGR